MFKNISYLQLWWSGGHFVRRSGTICAILVEGIMQNYFELGPVNMSFNQMSFKDICYL